MKMVLYFVVFVLWAIFCSILFMPLLLLPQRFMVPVTRFWSRGLLFLNRVLFCITWEVRGKEYIPEGACLVVGNHQSLWETHVLYLLFERGLYVLKQELTKNFLWGWHMMKIGCIPVDREAGISALKKLTADAQARLDEGRQVFIFPEGTRMPPGESGEYQAGVAAIYTKTDVPVAVFAHNAGLCIPKKGKIRSGHIIIEFLPPVESGLKRKEFMGLIEERITTAAERLYQEGLERRK